MNAHCEFERLLFDVEFVDGEWLNSFATLANAVDDWRGISASLIERRYALDATLRDGFARIGFFLLERHQFEEAKDWFEKDITRGRTSWFQQLRHAECLAALDHMDKGLERVKDVYSEFPEAVNGFAAIAWRLRESLPMETIREYAKRDLDADRLSLGYTLNVAVLICRANHQEEAKRIVESVYEKTPSLVDGFARLGEVMMERERWGDALALAETDWKRGRLSPERTIDLARLRARQSDIEGATALVEEAYRQKPTLMDGYAKVAEALPDETPIQIVIQLMERDRERKSLSAARLRRLANCYLKTGDYRRLVAVLADAIEIESKTSNEILSGGAATGVRPPQTPLVPRYGGGDAKLNSNVTGNDSDNMLKKRSTCSFRPSSKGLKGKRLVQLLAPMLDENADRLIEGAPVLLRDLDASVKALFDEETMDALVDRLDPVTTRLLATNKQERAHDLFNALADYKYRDYMENNTLKHVRRLYIQTTAVCNLNCAFCTFKTNQAAIPHIDLKLYEKTLTEVATAVPRLEWLVLHMSGEPLLHPRFVELLEITARVKAGFPAFRPISYLHTNGTLLTPDLCDRVLATGALDRITWSLDGVDRESFEATRVGASYDEVLDHFEYFLHHRPNGVEARVNNLVPPGLESHDEDSRLKRLLALADRVDRSTPSMLNNEKAPSRQTRSTPSGNLRLCDYVFHSVVITSSGQMSLCCVDYNTRNAFGDLVKDGFVNTYLGERRRNLLTHLKRGERVALPGCAKCRLVKNGWFS